MSDVINLYDDEAIDKLKELVESADICLFTTALTKLPLATRPMSTSQVDDHGNLWFLSQKSSAKNAEIVADKRVQLFYFNKTSSEYLSVYGEASVSYNKTKAREIWSTIAKAWFAEGVDDPEVSVIKVVPIESHYWDTKSNKIIAFLKIAAAVVTGHTMDDGVEGSINF